MRMTTEYTLIMHASDALGPAIVYASDALGPAKRAIYGVYV